MLKEKRKGILQQDAEEWDRRLDDSILDAFLAGASETTISQICGHSFEAALLRIQRLCHRNKRCPDYTPIFRGTNRTGIDWNSKDVYIFDHVMTKGNKDRVNNPTWDHLAKLLCRTVEDCKMNLPLYKEVDGCLRNKELGFSNTTNDSSEKTELKKLKKQIQDLKMELKETEHKFVKLDKENDRLREILSVSEKNNKKLNALLEKIKEDVNLDFNLREYDV